MQKKQKSNVRAIARTNWGTAPDELGYATSADAAPGTP